MNPKINYYCGWCSYEREEKKPTLSDLQEQVSDIDNQIEQVNNLDISEAIKLCALAELKEKKQSIIKAMHKCIDEMMYN